MVLGGYTLATTLRFSLFFFRSSSSEFRAPYIDAPVVLNLTLPQSLWEHINTHTHTHVNAKKHTLLPHRLERSFPPASFYFEVATGFTTLSSDESKKSKETVV